MNDHRQISRRSIRWIPIVAAALGLVILAIVISKTTDKPADQSGVVVVTAPTVSNSPAANTPAVIATPTPVATRVPLPTGAAVAIPVVPPAQITEALKLSDAARMRQALPIERRNDVVCGEISPSGDARDYRRFVYIGAAKVGKLDDGSADFAKYLEMVCIPQADR